jgi:hypothetical protein
VSRRQSDWVQWLSTDWAWKANGKENRGQMCKRQLYAKSYSHGLGNGCPWRLRSILHGTLQVNYWDPLSHMNFHDFTTRKHQGTQGVDNENDRVKMNMTHIKRTWRVETSVLGISGESQGWWPMDIIQATCKVETGRMVVWGELGKNGNEIPFQLIKAGLCQMCLSSQLRMTFGGAEVGVLLAGMRPWVQVPVTPKKQQKNLIF